VARERNGATPAPGVYYNGAVSVPIVERTRCAEAEGGEPREPHEMPSYNSLIIRVLARDGATYSVLVEALFTDGTKIGPPAGSLVFNDRDELRGMLDLIEEERVDPDLLKRVGRALFDHMFGRLPAARDAYTKTLDRALFGKLDGVRIQLAIADAARELYGMPWPLMYDDGREGWLGRTALPHQWTPLSYYVEPVVAIPSPETPLPLRLLVVAATPSDLPTINVQAEISAIQKAVAAPPGRIHIRELRSAPGRSVTRDALRSALQTWRPHILHFIGHGPETRDLVYADPSLYLQERDGGKDRCNLAALMGSIQYARATIPLVVLNACNTDGLAHGLARQGIARPFERHATFLKAHHALRHTLRDANVLLDDHQAHAFAGECRHRVVDLLDHDRRQTQAQFVAQQHVGVAHQRTADRYHLLLAARQLGGRAAPLLLEDGE
jgi:hypothetical protein